MFEPKDEVLIIDDDPVSIFLAKKILNKERYKGLVNAYTDPETGLAHLKEVAAGKKMPKFLLLDLNMPIMSGWDVLDIIQGIPALDELRVFVYSSSSLSADIERSENYASVKGFLCKPITPEKLQELAIL